MSFANLCSDLHIICPLTFSHLHLNQILMVQCMMHVFIHAYIILFIFMYYNYVRFCIIIYVVFDFDALTGTLIFVLFVIPL